MTSLTQVVDGHRELIGPVAVAVPEQEVAALLGGRLFETAGEQVVKPHGLGIEPYAHPSAGDLAESTVAAAAVVALTADVRREQSHA